MKIIADTNIWYAFGQEDELFESVQLKAICPTFVNIYELSKSENVVDKEELSRNAIRKLFSFQDNAIYEPPFIYLANLNQKYDFDVVNEIGHWLEFTSRFAKGYSISPGKVGLIKDWMKEQKIPTLDFAEYLNAQAFEIHARIDKREHKKIDTVEMTGNFLDSLVKQATNEQCTLIGYEMDNYELLVKSLDHFFTLLETSHMKFQANDWYDFAILAYVQPGDKYWTREKRWLKMIKDAGCEDYLYKE